MILVGNGIRTMSPANAAERGPESIFLASMTPGSKVPTASAYLAVL